MHARAQPSSRDLFCALQCMTWRRLLLAGYMVARTLAAAPTIANSIVEQLAMKKREREREREGVSGSEDGGAATAGGYGGDDVSAAVWSEAWPVWRKDQRDFFCFGMEVLLKVGGGLFMSDGARSMWVGGIIPSAELLPGHEVGGRHYSQVCAVPIIRECGVAKNLKLTWRLSHQLLNLLASQQARHQVSLGA